MGGDREQVVLAALVRAQVDGGRDREVARQARQAPQALPALFAGARLLGVDEREKLAAQWRYWQEHGDGIRYVDAQGALQQHPADHYDNALVNAIKVAGKWPVARLVGEVMVCEEQAWLSDSFLFWRVKKLVDAGVLKRENVPGAMPLICHW